MHFAMKVQRKLDGVNQHGRSSANHLGRFRDECRWLVVYGHLCRDAFAKSPTSHRQTKKKPAEAGGLFFTVVSSNECDGQSTNGGTHNNTTKPRLAFNARVDAASDTHHCQQNGSNLPNKALNENEYIDTDLLFAPVCSLQLGFFDNQVN